MFSSFLYLLYSQFSLYFLALSSFCIFRVYLSPIFSSILYFQFFTYIFVYFRAFHIFHILRLYSIFYILKFSIFSLLLCFSYVLYFELLVPAITEATTVYLIPVMLKDWWLWWGNQKMGEYFYDLISLKLKYILYIQMIIKSQWKV